MKYLSGFCLSMALGLSAIAAPAAATPLGVISNFGPNLADTACSSPEGLAADSHGNFYTASDRDGDTVGTVCVFDSHGAFTRTIPVPAGASGFVALLGLAFGGPHTLYACDLGDGNGSGRVVSIDTLSGAVRVLATGFTFPNAIAVDGSGKLFVSDSVLGTINRMSPSGANNVVWASSPLLTSAGFPPLGANGVAFDMGNHNLYVANTGDSRVLRIPVKGNGSAGPIQIFADGPTIDRRQHMIESLHGADGVALDILGNLYVAANQVNEIHVLSPAGTLIARFAGSGATALDFPASLVFKGAQLYFTNASLFDDGAGSHLSVIQLLVPGLPLN
jgi:sugar lactone lactonase YvrE